MPGNSAVPRCGNRYFRGFIAPLHGRSDVEKNVATASTCQGGSVQKLRSARPE